MKEQKGRISDLTKESDTIKWDIRVGDPTVLGVRKMGEGYNFAVIVRNGVKASLLFYLKGSTTITKEIPLPKEERIGDVGAVFLLNLCVEEYEYNYRIDDKIVPDPYARALTGRSVFGETVPPESPHQVRGCLYSDSMEKKTYVYIPYEDTILYKLHVRGYTKQKYSKVKDKGTFRGLQDKIPYLKELGITSVELMPCYDFNELPLGIAKDTRLHSHEMEPARLNYWGYTDGYYFAPKASFCATENPVEEFQTLVEALHKNGMECLMEFYFAADTDPVFILEALRFWKITYGVDGFHLTGEGMPIEMIVKDAVLQNTKLLYIGFPIAKIYENRRMQPKVLAEYNLKFMENMRRFLKGDEDQILGFIWHIKNNPDTHGVINHITSQDGFTLYDLVSYDYRHNEDNGENNADGSSYNYSWNCGAEGNTRKLTVLELRKKQMKNSILYMMLSQGTPMIYAGDELGNTQSGNNNAYCQDNPLGWVDWSKSKRSEEMYAFVKEAIAFRKSHPILHVNHEVRDMDYHSVGIPEISFHSQRAWVPDLESSSRQIGVLYCGEYAKDQEGNPDCYIYMAYNMHWEEQEFALPKLPVNMEWYLSVNTNAKNDLGIYQGGSEKKTEEKKNFKVPPRTIVVLTGRRAGKK